MLPVLASNACAQRHPEARHQDRFFMFVIVFQVFDYPVVNFELPPRSSGFRDFMASDFRAGDEVTLNNFTFLTADADGFAKTFMEAERDSSDSPTYWKQATDSQNRPPVLVMDCCCPSLDQRQGIRLRLVCQSAHL
jgi:hypothetical protein